MTRFALDNSRRNMTPVLWLVCIIAVIGFLFDTYELLMLPLIARPAILELGGIQPGTPDFAAWIGRLFYIPAICGGVFGLLGGYLTDLLGRRRVLGWSILLYAVSAFLAGYSTSLPMLLVLRCTTFIGVCVEFVAAVAWLAELFPEPAQRERVLGFTQTFSSFGGILVAFANDYTLTHNLSLPAIHLPEFLSFLGNEGRAYAEHGQWRYTLMSGLIPAIPLILVRPFLPESPVWREKRASGMLRRPSILELFSPELRRTTVVTTLMFACSLGVAFGAIQQMPQIIAAVPEVQQLIKTQVASLPKLSATRPTSAPTLKQLAATAPVAPGLVPIAKPISSPSPDPRAKAATMLVIQQSATSVSKIQEYGGLFGRVVLAILALYVVSRKTLIRIFQVPGIFIIPIVFAYAATHSLEMLKVGMFFAGMVAVAQLSFWGNYLPTVYPVHLRGTGESFAANVGGRMLGTLFAWVTATLALSLTPVGTMGGSTSRYWAEAAALVGCGVFVVGFLLSFFLPESRPELE